MRIKIGNYSIAMNDKKAGKMSKEEFVAYAKKTFSWAKVDPEVLEKKFSDAYDAAYAGKAKKKKE